LGLRPDETQSPGVLQKMIRASVRCNSYREASQELEESAELRIDAKTLERAVRRVGGERVEQRDAEVEAWKQLPLPVQQRGCPEGKVAPKVAVVQFDCGRMLIRERKAKCKAAKSEGAESTSPESIAEQVAEALAEQQADGEALAEAEENGTSETIPGDKNTVENPSRSRYWRDDKVGVLLTMVSEEHESDPCPDIPATFLDRQRTPKLVQELGHSSGVPRGSSQQPATPETATPQTDRPGSPKPLVKSIVASRACSAVFGAILAAAAWCRGFAGAPRKAFVADGAAMNWTMQARYFSHYTPILDFIHALQYVYSAANAGRDFDEGWAVYCRWIQAIWAGRVDEVLSELRARQEEIGLPPPKASATDPRQIVATTVGYLETHRKRMSYAQYRRLGLPIMSSYVESAVKQIGRRVKATEKFWCEAGAEAILQLRADYLSDTAALERFLTCRTESATGHRTYRRTAAAPGKHCAA
jgi:hypothetical protein